MSRGLGDIKSLGDIKTVRRTGKGAEAGAASPYLNIYRGHLRKEKERLEKELMVFETRTAAIAERLANISRELGQLEEMSRKEKKPRTKAGEGVEEELPKWKKLTLNY